MSRASVGDLVGQVIAGRYRILQKLGEGAMGAVYLGEHLKIGRKDAIKVMRDALAGDTEAARRFMRGARNVSAIKHPNVCTVYDFSDTADGLSFLAMEYIPGESLRELLEREGRLPLARAVGIGRQVADALEAAHEAGIVHRDLKPANIMLMRGRGGADLVKVVDFDIAKGAAETDESEVTRHGFVVGTPEYMSPEQLLGDRLDGRSDLYSLGLIIFRMLTGTLPFRAISVQDMMVQRLTHTPLQLHEVLPDERFPARLQQVLDRLFVREASGRLADAAVLARELGAMLSDEIPATKVAPAGALVGTPIAAPAGARRGIARYRLHLAAAGVVVVVLGIVAAAVLGGDGGVEQRGSVQEQVPIRRESTPEPVGVVSDETGGGGAVREGGEPSRVAPDDVTPYGAQSPGGSRALESAERDPAPQPGGPSLQERNSASAQELSRFDGLLDSYLDDKSSVAAGTLEHVREGATRIFNQTDLERDTRAKAAYLVGNTYSLTERWAECVRWANRALDLREDERGFRSLRDACRDAQ